MKLFLVLILGLLAPLLQAAETGAPAAGKLGDQLFLKQRMNIRFRLIFRSVNGDLKKPETLEFQVDTVDLRQPSEFLKINDLVPNTKFKLVKFESKERLSSQVVGVEDVSELTLMNLETSQPVVMVINKVVDVPDVFAIFEYRGERPAEFRVKQHQNFLLPPDAKIRCKLLDVTDEEAVIQLLSGEKLIIRRAPQK